MNLSRVIFAALTLFLLGGCEKYPWQGKIYYQERPGVFGTDSYELALRGSVCVRETAKAGPVGGTQNTVPVRSRSCAPFLIARATAERLGGCEAQSVIMLSEMNVFGARRRSVNLSEKCFCYRESLEPGVNGVNITRSFGYLDECLKLIGPDNIDIVTEIIEDVTSRL